MTTQQDERAELIAALKSYKQADEDGVMVLVSRQACDEAAALLEADAKGGEAVAWRDGVNVARLRASLTRMGIATEPSEEGTAADLENWVNALTRAVTRPQQAAQVPLTDEQIDEIQKDWIAKGMQGSRSFARAIEAAHGITTQTPPPGHILCLTCDGKGYQPIVDPALNDGRDQG